MRRRTLPVAALPLQGLAAEPDQTCARRMAAFDQLPASVRQALDASICDFNAITVLDRYREHGEASVLSLIRNSEAEARRNWRTQRGPVLDRARHRFSFGP